MKKTVEQKVKIECVVLHVYIHLNREISDSTIFVEHPFNFSKRGAS